jgi:tetratricopeptide (TPR) repeat protein
LASIYRRQNKPRELLETLVKGFTRGKGSLDGLKPELEAIQKDPKLVESLIEAGRKLAHEDPPQLDFAGSYVLGNLAAEAGQWEAAQEFYQIALASRKGKPAELYQELARHLFDAKRYGDAAKVYKTAVEDPALAERKVQFLYLLSRVLELNNETKEAIEAITAALKEIPDNEGLKFQEAWIYYHSQQFDEAIPRLEKLISSADDKEIQRQAQFSLSNVYVQQGNILKGEAILEAVLKEDPNDPSVNNDLGYLYADQGKNLEQAESMITKALTAEPENVAYLDSMGWVLFKRGKFAEALPHLEKACQKPAGVDATIWDHLADVYDRLEQPAKALQNWTKALEEAKQSPRPDTKLIGRIEEKIKNHKAGTGQLRPERPNSP